MVCASAQARSKSALSPGRMLRIATSRIIVIFPLLTPGCPHPLIRFNNPLNAPSVARPRRDDGLRFGKGALEIRTFTRADVEDRHFEDHVDIPLTMPSAHPPNGPM
jgi:hypothetical protein